MIDLSDICGLPIMLDEETGSLSYDDSINYRKKGEVDLKEMLPILLNKFLKYPEKVYETYYGIAPAEECKDDCEGVSYNLFHVPHGLLGIEYSKTHIYRTDADSEQLSCIAEVSKGHIMVVIQKNELQNDPFVATPVENVTFIELEEGERCAIPAGVFYTFVNIGGTQAIIAIMAKELAPIDYSLISKEKGLAYYIISKNARLEVVSNPKYRVKEPLKHMKWKTASKDEKNPYRHEVVEHKSHFYDAFNTFMPHLDMAFA